MSQHELRGRGSQKVGTLIVWFCNHACVLSLASRNDQLTFSGCGRSDSPLQCESLVKLLGMSALNMMALLVQHLGSCAANGAAGRDTSGPRPYSCNICLPLCKARYMMFLLHASQGVESSLLQHAWSQV